MAKAGYDNKKAVVNALIEYLEKKDTEALKSGLPASRSDKDLSPPADASKFVEAAAGGKDHGNSDTDKKLRAYYERMLAKK